MSWVTTVQVLAHPWLTFSPIILQTKGGVPLTCIQLSCSYVLVLPVGCPRISYSAHVTVWLCPQRRPTPSFYQSPFLGVQQFACRAVMYQPQPRVLPDFFMHTKHLLQRSQMLMLLNMPKYESKTVLQSALLCLVQL